MSGNPLCRACVTRRHGRCWNKRADEIEWSTSSLIAHVCSCKCGWCGVCGRWRARPDWDEVMAVGGARLCRRCRRAGKKEREAIWFSRRVRESAEAKG